MPGGTALISGGFLQTTLIAGSDDFLAVKPEIILEYEQTIAELRRQLLHYKRLVANLVPATDTRDEYELASPIAPIGPASVKLINSIVSARIPASATFQDFEEGEL